MKLRFIGDVHRKVDAYFRIRSEVSHSICVGDFGFRTDWDQLNSSTDLNYYIVPGNHDQHPDCLTSAYSCGNCAVFDIGGSKTLMTVRGASSKDKNLRTQGVDWFPEEELNHSESSVVYDIYTKYMPSIVVSHDCPQQIAREVFQIYEKSYTRSLLQAMFEAHQPELWVFGHHHKTIEVTVNETKFVCLDELKTLDVEVDKFNLIKKIP